MSTSPTNNNTVEQTVEIRNPDGLHMRPAMQFVDLANSFESKITIEKDGETVDGKSIYQITMLAATRGTKLKVVASGPDAENAIDLLVKILERETPEDVSQAPGNH